MFHHQSAGDGEHLLLAAGESFGGLGGAGFQDGEQAQQPFAAFGALGFGKVLAAEGDVLGNREIAEELAGFGALHDAGAGDLLALLRKTWLDNMERHLQAGGITLAVVNIDMLMEPGGFIDALQARGYTVEPP